MINLSNDEALSRLREHEKFEQFLKTFTEKKYPGISLDQAFMFISTGVLVEGMSLDSALRLMRDIKRWVSKNSHGGLRRNAGRKKFKTKLRNITLTADEKDIVRAQKYAAAAGTSLQSAFRVWLRQLSAEEIKQAS